MVHVSCAVLSSYRNPVLYGRENLHCNSLESKRIIVRIDLAVTLDGTGVHF